MTIDRLWAGIPVSLKGRQVEAHAECMWDEHDTLLVRKRENYYLYILEDKLYMLLRVYPLGEQLHANIEVLEEVAYFDEQMELIMNDNHLPW